MLCHESDQLFFQHKKNIKIEGNFFALSYNSTNLTTDNNVALVLKKLR